MRWPLNLTGLLWLLATACLFPFCTPGTGKVSPAASVSDTLWLDWQPYREAIDSTLEAAGYLRFFVDLARKKLEGHPALSSFDTALLIRGYNGSLGFRKGDLFTGSRTHAFVHIHEAAQDLFLLFTRKETWTLRQVIHGITVEADSAYHFLDYNFDGFNDVALFWNYSAGRCSCRAPGCRRVYLYDPVQDQLRHVPLISQYLEVAIAPEEKALYLGEHCEGFYGRFTWQGPHLQKVEEYRFRYQDLAPSGAWILEHNRYRQNKKISSRVVKKGQLPPRWKQRFTAPAAPS